MALNALTLAVTQGVVGRPFLSAVNGLTYPQRVEVLVDGSPGGSYVNGTVFFSSLPYPTSTIVLREYEPGVGAGFRDSRIDITGATNDALRTQALASLSVGRTLRNWRVGAVRQSDGSYVYSLFAEDDLGATSSLPAGGTPPALFTLTQPLGVQYQRTTFTGGANGLGQGMFPLDLDVTQIGDLHARIVDEVTGTTVQNWFKIATLTLTGSQRIWVTPIDVRLGWFYIDISGDGGSTYTRTTRAVSVGPNWYGTGQSRMTELFDIQPSRDSSLPSANGVAPSKNGRVFATWFETGNDGTTLPSAAEVPGDTSRYRSSGAVELTAKMVALLGCNVQWCGHARGATALAEFTPTGSQWAIMKAIMDQVGGFEVLYISQGYQDATNSAANYKIAQAACVNGLAALNSLGNNFAFVHTALTNVGPSATFYPSYANHQKIRNAAADGCRELSGTYPFSAYLDIRDCELVADNVHGSQPGNIRVMRHLYRTLRPYYGAANGDGQVTVLSATRASGSADIVIRLQPPTGVSLGTLPAEHYQRWRGYVRGDATLANTPTYTFSAATLTANGDGTYNLTLTLSTTPDDTVALDLYFDGYPGLSADGTIGVLYDTQTDGDGITQGRPVNFGGPRATTAYAPGVTAPSAVTVTNTGAPRLYQTFGASVTATGATSYDHELIYADTGQVVAWRSTYGTTSTTASVVIVAADLAHTLQWKTTCYNNGGKTVAYSSVVTPDTKRGGTITAVGSPTWTTGKFGQGLQGASGAYGSFADVSGLIPRTRNWTIEGWIKPPASNPSGTIVAFGQASKGYIAINTSGQMLAVIRSNTANNVSITTSTSVVGQDFIHVALTAYTSSSTTGGFKLFVGGVMVAELADSTTNLPYLGAGAASQGIGGLAGSNYFIGGVVDMVATWDYARYLTDFTPPTAPYTGTETGLYAGYLLDGNFTPIG